MTVMEMSINNNYGFADSLHVRLNIFYNLSFSNFILTVLHLCELASQCLLSIGNLFKDILGMGKNQL